MNTEVTELTINGIIYVPKDSLAEIVNEKGIPYVLCRTYSAGVFAGLLESRNGQEVIMRNARRIWYWTGAASLSELSVHGTKTPNTCKFPCAVNKIELTQVIEVLHCTEKAKKSIEEVKIWTA